MSSVRLPPLHGREIADFLVRFLTSFGAEVKESDGRLAAHLPQSLADELRTERQLYLRCENVPKTGSDEEYVTFGHPLLDRMLDMAKRRGLAASFLFATGLDADFVEGAWAANPFVSEPSRKLPRPPEGKPALTTLVQEARRFHFAGARVRVVNRRVLHQAQVLFYFKVSLISDEKRDMLVPLLIDPVTENVDRPVDVSGAVSFVPHFDDGFIRNATNRSYTLTRLYSKACRHLERRIEESAVSFEKRAQERMRAELERIEAYYRGLAEEKLEPLRKLFRRIASASVRADLARSWQTESRYTQQAADLREEAKGLESVYEKELQGLNNEKERRVQEIREKYTPRAEVTLTHTAHVMVPRLVWSLRLHGTVRRDVDVIYDVLRRRFVDWVCESCERPLRGALSLCSCECLLCTDCIHYCDTCGNSFCPECAGEERCHICGDLVCPTCQTVCPLADQPGYEAAAGFEICSRCRQETCPVCTSMSRLHLESVF